MIVDKNCYDFHQHSCESEIKFIHTFIKMMNIEIQMNDTINKESARLNEN